MSEKIFIGTDSGATTSKIAAVWENGEAVSTRIFQRPTNAQNGRDAAGVMPQRIEDQCANMFAHMKAIVEAGGGTTSDIIKMTVWLQDHTQRGPVNTEWLRMFPDEHSRPARHALPRNMEGGALVQCDFTAVID